VQGEEHLPGDGGQINGSLGDPNINAVLPLRRLVLVGPVPPPAGGMANQTRLIKALLESDGIEVQLVPVNPPYRPEWVGKLKGLRAALRLAGYVPRLWRSASSAELFHVMANSGWSWHLFAVPAIWVAHIKGIPVIVNYRGGGADKFFDKSFARVWRTLKKASLIIVPSEYLQDVFGRRKVGTKVVPNIIDTTLFFNKGYGRSEKDISDPHVIVCRNLEKIYGIDVAIASFKLMKQTMTGARLTIAGSGSQEKNLKNLAESYGLSDSVIFTGMLNNNEMAALYQDADIFLNTSHVDNMPNSILEAMACGVPVVTTGVGGIPRIAIDGETALFVPENDVESTATALLSLAKNSDLRRHLTRNAYESILKYTWKRVRVELYDAYRMARQGAKVTLDKRGIPD